MARKQHLAASWRFMTNTCCYARACYYARLIAQTICPHLADSVGIAAFNHDAGKIKIPGHLLYKPGKLSGEEWALVRQHPVIGAKMFCSMNSLTEKNSLIALAIRHHHERWDGKGYPDGLRSGGMPFAARVIAVADAFDAMTTGRSYRGAMSKEQAIQEIIRFSGKQFDPAIAGIAVKIFK